MREITAAKMPATQRSRANERLGEEVCEQAEREKKAEMARAYGDVFF